MDTMKIPGSHSKIWPIINSLYNSSTWDTQIGRPREIYCILVNLTAINLYTWQNTDLLSLYTMQSSLMSLLPTMIICFQLL